MKPHIPATRRLRPIGVLATTVCLAAAACQSQPRPAPQDVVVWKTVEFAAGRGGGQTGSFLSETGEFRVRWQTSNEIPAGAGVFKLTANSAVSGRVIADAVDHHGVGSDIAYVRDVPRMFYLVVESSNVDWSVTVEEPTSEGTAVGASR